MEAFKTVCFPNAPELSSSQKRAQTAQAKSASSGDTINEIKKYKALLDEGIITQQEFDAKKKQLLGI